ncbi:MAG: class I SAM-dependent methyltransferase [Myxococcota bacterium]
MNDRTGRAEGALRPVTPHDILADLVAQIATRLGHVPGQVPGQAPGQAPSQESPSDELRDLVVRAHALARGLAPYVEQHTTAPSSALQALADATGGVDWKALHAGGQTGVKLESEMLCGPVEAQFLSMLVGLSGARRVLEIGLFTGYSALAMAQALPADGRLVALEREPWLVEFARGHFDRSEHGHKIKLVTGPADQSLRTLRDEGETFDLVFIDADKGGYVAYLDAVLDGILQPGGLIVVDNTLLQGQPWLEERSAAGAAIAAFNERVAHDERLEHVIVPLRDGVSLIRVRGEGRGG